MCFVIINFKVVFVVGVSGIPGLDESYLPRWIGYGFGSLLILNHFVGSDSSTTTLPQLVSHPPNPFLSFFLSLLGFSFEFCFLFVFVFWVSIENRSSGSFIGSILNCNSLSWKISQGKFLLLLFHRL